MSVFAPKATCIVPKIFSASRNSFTNLALGLIPKANSPTMSDQSSVSNVCLTLRRIFWSFECSVSALPFFATTSMDVSSLPIPPMAMSQTSLPSSESSTGATMTSPVGRFIHFMDFQSSFVSVKNSRFSVLNVKLVPAGLLISTFAVLFKVCINLSALPCMALCSRDDRARAPSVSMSIVTPGQCPRRERWSRVCIFTVLIRKGVSSRFSRMRLTYMSGFRVANTSRS